MLLTTNEIEAINKEVQNLMVHIAEKADFNINRPSAEHAAEFMQTGSASFEKLETCFTLMELTDLVPVKSDELVAKMAEAKVITANCAVKAIVCALVAFRALQD